MRRALILAVTLAGCGGGDVSITDSEVKVATQDLDAAFSRGEAISGDYMLFGADYMDRKNLLTPVALTGVPMEDAREISADYPDFYKCASPGAERGKDAAVQFMIVAADSGVLSTLESISAEFKESIKSGGDRVSVHLEGSFIELTSVVHRESGQDFTDKYPDQAYAVITAASKVDTKAALGGE